MAIDHYSWNELPRQSIFDKNLSGAALRTVGALVTFDWFEPCMPQSHCHSFDHQKEVFEGAASCAGATSQRFSTWNASASGDRQD
jgi:hypothetical protein